MLRRMTIGGRVNLLVAVPLLALFAVAALSYVVLERSSGRGVDARDLQLAQDLRAQVLLYGGGGVALVALCTVWLAVRVRRSIVRPIRSMTAQAASVAGRDLAAAVAATDGLSADAPVPHLPPFHVGTRDELAALAGSVTSVQDTAVDLAAAQRRARQVMSQNFVCIARRNQSLLGTTLGFISTLEQDERDPEMLDNLFRIDHLATRLRRSAQSLLVLAGAEPTRLGSPAVALGDVVRAALSEVEHYEQIELGDVGSAHVQGAVAHEVSHLLAELLDNATNFSPPTTIVTVVGRAVPDGHQLAVFDHGLGMSAADMMAANERLNAMSPSDLDSGSTLGFQVIATLARRHGIQVMLTTTPGGTGVTAVVRLPKSILEAQPAHGADEAYDALHAPVGG